MAIDNSISPTLTLAQLYEAQKLYMDAFVIYSKLYNNNPTDDLKEKIHAVEVKMFQDDNIEYNNIVNIIFEQTEKEKFRILPDQNYQNIKNSTKNKDFDPIEFIEEEIPENEQEYSEMEEIEIEYPGYPNEQLNSSPSSESFIPSPPKTSPQNHKSLDYTITEFAQIAVNLVGKNKKISDLTIADLKLIFKQIF